MKPHLIAALMTVSWLPAWSQPAIEQGPYLPAQALVKPVVLSHPQVQSAIARQQALGYRSEAVRAGVAEYTVRSSVQRRRVPGSDGGVGEAMVSIERPVRWWGKAGKDEELSKQMQALGQLEYADAVHETSRELVKLWFAWLRALAGQDNAAAAQDIAAQLHRQAQARLRVGEVSRLDAELAAAEWARTQSAVHLATATADSARSALTRRYPGLPLPTRLRIERLPELGGNLVPIQQEYLEKNHELNMLRVDAQRLQLTAQRVQLERRPDPTIGVFAASDRGGAEKVAGISFSMPLAGVSRTAQAQAALADANAAQEKVRAAEMRLAQEFESNWQQLQHKRLAAQQLQQASLTQQMAAEKSRRAYALGEAGFSDVLLASRSASEQRLQSDQLQLDAAELHDLIRLDLHQFWDFDD